MIKEFIPTDVAIFAVIAAACLGLNIGGDEIFNKAVTVVSLFLFVLWFLLKEAV